MIDKSKENMIMNTDYTWNLSLIELLDLLQQPVDDYEITPLTNQEAVKATTWIEAVAKNDQTTADDIMTDLEQEEYDAIADMITYHLIHGDYQAHITSQDDACQIAHAASNITVSAVLTLLANQQ